VTECVSDRAALAGSEFGLYPLLSSDSPHHAGRLPTRDVHARARMRLSGTPLTLKRLQFAQFF
jgi:hypothetical protein